MPSDYFHRLHRETATRFWVNNPSGADLEGALAAGAISCTTNPAYCAKLLQSDRDYLHGVIDAVLREETAEVEAAAVRVYQRASQRVLDRFRPLYEQNGGACGFVTLQDDPRLDQDAAATIRCALANRRLGPNYMAKIPVIRGGIDALEACVTENIPICATEIFSISQAIFMCERYAIAAERAGNRPPFYVTHISGIFDQYLGVVAKRDGIKIERSVLDQAGCTIARKEYRLLKERGYPGILLGGGARGTHHFTEMVGGDAHVTVNWSTAQEIIDADVPILPRMAEGEPSSGVIAELREKFPDFRKAYDEDGLTVEEFAEFGPVRFFRNAFLNGWHLLLAEVAARRNVYAI
jgi:transaldolase